MLSSPPAWLLTMLINLNRMNDLINLNVSDGRAINFCVNLNVDARKKTKLVNLNETQRPPLKIFYNFFNHFELLTVAAIAPPWYEGE